MKKEIFERGSFYVLGGLLGITLYDSILKVSLGRIIMNYYLFIIFYLCLHSFKYLFYE